MPHFIRKAPYETGLQPKVLASYTLWERTRIENRYIGDGLPSSGDTTQTWSTDNKGQGHSIPWQRHVRFQVSSLFENPKRRKINHNRFKRLKSVPVYYL